MWLIIRRMTESMHFLSVEDVSVMPSVAIILSSSALPVELLPSSTDRFTASKLSSGGLGGIFLVKAMTARIKISILKRGGMSCMRTRTPRACIQTRYLKSL